MLQCTRVDQRHVPGQRRLRQLLEHLAQARNQQRRQRPAFLCLRGQGEDAGALGVMPDAIQQRRLADAAQSHQDGTLGRPAYAYALQRDAQRLPQFIAAHQFGGDHAGAGCERVMSSLLTRLKPSPAPFSRWR